MLKIIVDTMGGDNGSSVVVDAIINFLNKNKDVEIVAVGKQEELTKLEGICEIIDARDIVPMEAGPMEVMRMRTSSMVVAVKKFKELGADAVISCGSTGGFLSACTNSAYSPSLDKRSLPVSSVLMFSCFGTT